jgi:peptidoglycan/LPS O-acetylase OafA/YrhL
MAINQNYHHVHEVDDTGNLVDDMGNLVDDMENLVDGMENLVDDMENLVDDMGNLVDDMGNLVDDMGNLVDDMGNLVDGIGNVADAVGNSMILIIDPVNEAKRVIWWDIESGNAGKLTIDGGFKAKTRVRRFSRLKSRQASRKLSRVSEAKLKRWEILPSTGSHFDLLDGLRGVAILLVVCRHAFYTNPSRGFLSTFINYTLIQSGWMGVPIFFVLSGFLISYPFLKARLNSENFWRQPGYFARRAGKIIPPFYFSIVLFVLFFWWQEGNVNYLKSGLVWASGLGNFVVTYPKFNEYYWSLIVEGQFYLVLPLLMWLLRGVPAHRLSLVLFLVLLLVPLLSRYLVWPHGIYVSDGEDREFQLLLKRFPSCLDYFGWGILMAGIYVQLSPNLKNLRALAQLGYVGCIMLAIVLLFWGIWESAFSLRSHPTRWSDELQHWLPSLSAFLMLFFLFDSQCLGARLLSMGWLRFIGIVSFEWYLFHPPVCHWFLEHFGATHGNPLAYCLKTFFPVITTFCFSVLVYRFFSLPILNHVRGWVKTTTN